MKIFISWSGERSEAQAKALREWLPLVLHYAEPWLSKSDIEAGERWSAEVAKELEACNFGILCLTRDNLSSPWILFEAGALAKSIDKGRVIPLLLDLEFKEVSGPLSQFQAKKMDEAGVKELVLSLNKASKSPIADGQLDTLYDALWLKMAEKLALIPKTASLGKHPRSQGDILEDLVSTVRGLELRFRDTLEARAIEIHSMEKRLLEGEIFDDESPRRRRKRSDLQHFMAKEVASHIADGRADPTRILVSASVFKDDIPLIYELGVEIFRLHSLERHVAARALGRKLISSLRILDGLPFIQEIGPSHRGTRFAIEEMLDTLDALQKEGRRTSLEAGRIERVRVRPSRVAPPKP